MSALKQVVYLALLVAGCGSVGCTQAERAALGVPVLSQVDAIGSVVSRAVGWCQENGADDALVLDALKAVSDKDPAAAVAGIRKMFTLLAAAGKPVPPEVVALVDTAEGAIAAEGIQDGLRAISGAPP